MTKRRREPKVQYGIRVDWKLKEMLDKFDQDTIREVLEKHLCGTPDADADLLKDEIIGFEKHIEDAKNNFMRKHGLTFEGVMEAKRQAEIQKEQMLAKEIEKGFAIWKQFKFREYELNYYFDQVWQDEMKQKGYKITFEEGRNRARELKLVQVVQ